MSTNTIQPRCCVELVHHGAAASSQPKTVCWMADHSLIYSSQGTLNIAQDAVMTIGKSQHDTASRSELPSPLMHISQTLRSSISELTTSVLSSAVDESTDMGSSNDSRPIITALGEIFPLSPPDISLTILGSTLSNGSIHIWVKSHPDSSFWREFICMAPMGTKSSPMNCIHGHYKAQLHQSPHEDGIYPDHLSILLFLFCASADGVDLVLAPIHIAPMDILHMSCSSTLNPILIPSHSIRVGSYMAATVVTHALISSDPGPTAWDPRLLLVAGTASPKGNRIHIHSIPMNHDWITFLLHPPNLHSSSKVHSETELLSDTMKHSFYPQVIHHGHLLGHLDWVSCLSFGTIHGNGVNTSLTTIPQDLLLASGSHDHRIRLWRFHWPTVTSPVDTALSMEEDDRYDDEDRNDDDEEDSSPIEDLDEGEARMYIHLTPSHKDAVEVQDIQMPISLEALLIGHEGRVTSVSWRPRIQNDSPPCLLSSSMDRSILLWMEELGTTEHSNAVLPEGTGVWVPISRVGSAGGIIGGSIGSSLLGFVDAAFSPCSNFIVGHAYGGSLHFWVSSERCVRDSSKRKEEDLLSQVERWTAAPSLTGHFRNVSDISWEAERGSYLLSVGSDQTCRLWSNIWNKDSIEIWREVARPQVHGYDLNAVVSIGDNISEPMHRFVSGADEKEIRAFDAPLASLRTLAAVQGNDSLLQNDTFCERVERAFVPALGLSNRYNVEDAMDENDGSGQAADSKTVTQSADMKTEVTDTIMTQLKHIISVLPFERDLGVISVWPEFRKLFGHQSEVVSLAVGKRSSSPTSILASTSKARDAENASIRLWDVQRGSCIDVLKGHKSTVVTLSFSSDGLYLASAGKDRRLCLWKMSTDGSYLASAVDIAHKRIIWSVHFCPEESQILASGSRDGTVKIWLVSENSKLIEKSKFEPVSKVGKKQEPVTAVAFSPRCISYDVSGREFLLAIGLESGLIEMWSLRIDGEVNNSISSLSLLQSFPRNICHFDVVKRLLWRPSNKTQENEPDTDSSKFTLASCSSDHGVRIFQISILSDASNL